MRSSSWNNISGSIFIECGFVDGKLIDSHTNKQLPQSLINNINRLFPYHKRYKEEDICFEITISFLSSGYYDPGHIYRDPYYCYPPESDDERILDDLCKIVMFNYSDSESERSIAFNLDKDISEELFELYYDQIYDKGLDFSQYDDSDIKYERMIEDKLFDY